jgi:hypothetical protein
MKKRRHQPFHRELTVQSIVKGIKRKEKKAKKKTKDIGLFIVDCIQY